ncbi:hypothetical protein XELAEV_18000047mg [Xenopus laevis]|uniref:Uncharacterized protein n=1 Tax=Xenopus laevis TaxID=8355 RepID=A0A974BQL0_XENLA|nr:hypothetical protein XELAEV_18000047mg [Xenopus laevis]
MPLSHPNIIFSKHDVTHTTPISRIYMDQRWQSYFRQLLPLNTYASLNLVYSLMLLDAQVLICEKAGHRVATF